jgi:hypothetical protein
VFGFVFGGNRVLEGYREWFLVVYGGSIVVC